MALERTAGPAPAGLTAPITAPSPILPLAPLSGAAQSAGTPRRDDVLRLEVAQSAEGELLMTAADSGGARFRLSEDNLARLPPNLQQQLQPGQLLLVRVLATEPQLQLAVLERLGEPAPPSPAAAATAASPPEPDPPSLQLDQAAMRRFSRPLPDAPALASRWLTLALQALREQQQAGTLNAAQVSRPAAPPNGATPGVVPGAPKGAMADEAPAPPPPPPAWTALGLRAEAQDEAGLAQLPRPPQVLLLWQALAPDGLPLEFWLLRPPPGEGGRAGSGALGLQLRLLLRRAEGGSVLVEIALSPPGVALTLSTDRAALVPGLRGRLSLLAARLGCAGLRLMRCHVLHAPLPQPGPAAADAHLALARMALPPALFRAAAETLVALSPPFR